MATVETLMTIAEFALLPQNGQLRELVAGRVIEMNPPKPRHGLICGNVYLEIANFVKRKKLGSTLANDAGIVTHRDPDTLRGADVAYYSFARLPTEAIGNEYPTVAPELVCEVMSQYDRWPEVMRKAAEYLEAGVNVVCIFNPETESVTAVRSNRDPQIFDFSDEFALPDILPGFSVAVREFFT